MANEGIPVELYEMNTTGNLAGLVCSAKFGVLENSEPEGFLKDELLKNGSFVAKAALECGQPDKGALLIDKNLFYKKINALVQEQSLIKVARAEAVDIEPPSIIATGPLTSKALSLKLADFLGSGNLFLFNAIEPVIKASSINFEKTFQSENFTECPINESEFERLYDILINGRRIALKPFEETSRFFESCPPVEKAATLGKGSFIDMRLQPERGSYATARLRQNALCPQMFHLAGFQSNLRWGTQEKLIRSIPGLENAKILIYGMTHKNTFINSPAILSENLESRNIPGLFFAGQLSGTEGYIEAVATGLLAGKNAACFVKGKPYQTEGLDMTGAIARYISYPGHKSFQPIKAIWELMDK